MMTIVYSIPSIALGMSLYLSAGHIVTALTQTSVLLFYNEYMGKKLDKKAFSVHVMVLQTVVTLVVWMVFSVVSMYSSFRPIDRFLDGVYFAFLTISTVGFGDFSYSSEAALNTNFLLWALHAVLFCVGTGAIASIIGSINELIENGNIKVPKCCRNNKDDILGLTEMLKQTKPDFLTLNPTALKELRDNTARSERGKESGKNGEDFCSVTSTSSTESAVETHNTADDKNNNKPGNLVKQVGIESGITNGVVNTGFVDIEAKPCEMQHKKKTISTRPKPIADDAILTSVKDLSNDLC